MSFFLLLLSLISAANVQVNLQFLNKAHNSSMTEIYEVSINVTSEFRSPLMEHVTLDISRHIKHLLDVLEYHLKSFTAVETPLK